MDGSCRSTALGKVTPLASPSEPHRREGDPRLLFSQSQYVWRPSPEIEAELPTGFHHDFDCFCGRDGVRRFTPGGGGVGAFIVSASLSGSVLLARRRDLDREQRFGYHAARLLYQLGPRLREHFGRSFQQEQDLYIPRAGCTADTHVLPEGLGQEPQSVGRSWGPAELVSQGREKAIDAGCSNPDPGTCIRFGLLEAARRNPLDPGRLSEADALKIVRLGLFDLGPAQDRVEEPQIAEVTSRLLGAIERHLEDDTEKFNRWFFEEVDNVVHQVAKRKGSGGPIAREVVRQAILEIVFRAYRYLGDGIHELMQDFASALPQKLSVQEQIFFDRIYNRQAFLGNLPLILLQDRFDFLRECLLAILANPGEIRWEGTLLRLLQYYGEMTATKRLGDRRYKQQSQHRNSDNRSAGTWTLRNDESAPEVAVDLFQQVAEYLREERQAACRCETTLRWRAKLDDGETTPAEIVLADFCERCGHTEPVRLTRLRFQEIGEGLLRRLGREVQ